TGAVNVLVDITEQKKTQGALREALLAKDDFLGQVSHELRNPVTQLSGFAEMLRSRWRQLPIETQEEALQEIHSQAVRMRRLMVNMMVLSRVERGMMPDTEPHLIQHLLGETLHEFRRRYPAANVAVQVAADMPPVDTIASTIDQVVWNLLTNANKYGPPDGLISVVAARRDGHVEAVVRDQGPGVPADEMPRLFQPYFRSAATPEHAAGMGLGLSVCRRLLEAQTGAMGARRP